MSNNRKKPITGYITDSAGNVQKSASVSVKRVTATGRIQMDSVKTDESGYFTTKKLPAGVYEIYESGTHLKSVNHNILNYIPCYQPDLSGNTSLYKPFDIYSQIGRLSTDYYSLLQIEEVGSSDNGGDFPVMPQSLTNMGIADPDMTHISRFFGLRDGSDSITYSRFDVEYFRDGSENSDYIRWSGVPGIVYKEIGKVLIPLDYMSMVLSYPRRSFSVIDLTKIAASAINGVDNQAKITLAQGCVTDGTSGTNNTISPLDRNIRVGDVIEFVNNETKTIYPVIVNDKRASTFNGEPAIDLTVEAHKAFSVDNISFDSNGNQLTEPHSIDDIISGVNGTIHHISSYSGMFQGIVSGDDAVASYFTVTENSAIQGVKGERYTYRNATN